MTVTDTLETVFTLVGAERLLGGLGAMERGLASVALADTAVAAAQTDLDAALSAALLPISAMVSETKTLTAGLLNSVLTFGALAEAEGIAAAATGVLDAALGLLLSPLALIAAGLAVITGGLLVASKAASAFGETEGTTARVALQMRNLGNSFPMPELMQFANHMQDLTGINHNTIISLSGLAAQWGLTKDQIKLAAKVSTDIAASSAEHLAPDQVLRRILEATSGRTQGLRMLGINPEKIKGDIHDVNNVLSQIGQGFSGVASGFRQTLPGAVQALSSSMQRLWEAIGRFLGPALLPVINGLIRAVDSLTALLARWSDALHLPTGAELGAGGTVGSSLALKGDPEQTGLLRGIEKNTAKTADSFVRNVLGGSGKVAEAAFTIRDAKVAFAI